MNSCQKGKRIERAFRDLLREHGFKARRTQQFCGANGDSDVQSENLPDFHWEVKGDQRLNVHDALFQAECDCLGESDTTATIPVVAHKKNGTQFLVTLKASQFLEILRRTDLVVGGNNGGEE